MTAPLVTLDRVSPAHVLHFSQAADYVSERLDIITEIVLDSVKAQQMLLTPVPVEGTGNVIQVGYVLSTGAAMIETGEGWFGFNPEEERNGDLRRAHDVFANMSPDTYWTVKNAAKSLRHATLLAFFNQNVSQMFNELGDNWFISTRNDDKIVAITNDGLYALTAHAPRKKFTRADTKAVIRIDFANLDLMKTRGTLPRSQERSMSMTRSPMAAAKDMMKNLVEPFMTAGEPHRTEARLLSTATILESDAKLEFFSRYVPAELIDASRTHDIFGLGEATYYSDDAVSINLKPVTAAEAHEVFLLLARMRHTQGQQGN